MSSEIKGKKNSHRPKNPSEGEFRIVAIGTSAGGLETLELFFRNVPDNCGLAFIIIQHLDPNHKCLLAEILSSFTNMDVFEVQNKMKIFKNTIYVIPPNKYMAIKNSELLLSKPKEIRGLRLPVDYFFRSLATDQKDNSVGIILSGMGSDGSLGVKAIKENNGIVLVQSPETAKFDSMPRNAIQAVMADIISSPEELPKDLLKYLSFSPFGRVNSELNERIKNYLKEIIDLLYEKTGHDFSHYKKNTLFRRIERRISILHIDKLEAYLDYLKKNTSELEILFKELLIGVTRFFRDIEVWNFLVDYVIPEVFKKSVNGTVLRAWVPACSTGEEAYSLAIAFSEVKKRMASKKNIQLQIFSTDLDSEAINFARKGVFNASILSDVSGQRLDTFFTFKDDNYHIKQEIREMIVFAVHDIVKDPPFSNLDIVTCRNMLIYMEPFLQNKIFSIFNYSLKPGCFLILGKSESLRTSKNGFTEINSKLKIFKNISSENIHDLPGFRHIENSYKSALIIPMTTKNNFENIQTIAEQILIQHYSPASVMVDQKGNIIYITGRTGKYLEPIAGKANWNINLMAREGLRSILPGAFRKAKKDFKPIILPNVKFDTGAGFQNIEITVQQIESPESVQGMFMVIFKEYPFVEDYKNKVLDKGNSKANSQRIAELEYDLKLSLDELKIFREEMQTSEEEMKSIYEELQSTNEELQSSNEELTTSKEEMQSLNEELQTVNMELQNKVAEYMHTKDDMNNLLNSIEVATLFLDKKLKIRKYTDKMTGIFKLRHIDIGRPFDEVVSDLQYPEIVNHAKQVIKTLISMEIPVATNDDRWFNIRIMPYRTVDDRIDGLVITFTDISVAKKLELELEKANRLLKFDKGEKK
jgi:two-component system, chemotaxis family, CheB/CheR fusion protein